MTVYALDPETTRKAAAFVTAIAGVEEKFGLCLDLDLHAPLKFGKPREETPFAIVRSGDSLGLAVGS